MSEFTIRFYRLKDSVMCDRAGVIASGASEDVARVATIEEARKFCKDFAAVHAGLGCAVYGPDGRFVENIAGAGTDAGKRRPSRGRSAMLAALQLIAAALLVWWDASRNFGMILPTLLAARLVYGGLMCAADAAIGEDRNES